MALNELAKAYSDAVLGKTARGLPIIELAVDTFTSSYKKVVQRPAFPIVEWEMPETPPVAVADPELNLEPAPAVPFDDEVPF
jgi:hypothetical protein